MSVKSSKPNRKFCQAQIERCMVFENSFPKQTAGIQVLVDALATNARSDEHARRVVDHLLDHHEFCPVPAQIRTAAETISATPQVPSGCAACNGTGWLSVLVRGSETDLGPGKRDYAAKRCHCARGQHLAAMDAGREATR